MKVGIVGAGIGGLAAAAAFARTGTEVVVFERPGSVPTGAGISLFGNGLRALDAIGVGSAVRALGPPPELPAGIRRPDGHWLTRTSASATTDLRVVHRGDLHAILMAAVPTVRFDAVGEVHTSAGGAVVVLESGRRDEFDIVVGADGIGSRIRSTLFEDPGIRYAGYTAWRGVTTGPVVVTDAGETWGRGERFGIAPDGRRPGLLVRRRGRARGRFGTGRERRSSPTFRVLARTDRRPAARHGPSVDPAQRRSSSWTIRRRRS